MPLHFPMDEGLSLEESGMAVQTLPSAFGISSLSIANLRAGQFRAPVVQGSSKAQVLHTGHRGRKTLWSKLILVKASGLNLGHFHLLISGLGAINIFLRFAFFLRERFHIHNERILWRNPGDFQRSSLQTRKQWNCQVPLHQAQSTQTAHDSAKGAFFLLCTFSLRMVTTPNINFGRRIVI